jgi:hypothetical protein
MQGKLPQAPGELPTLNDWENHLTTIFPEVYPFICLHDGISVVARYRNNSCLVHSACRLD